MSPEKNPAKVKAGKARWSETPVGKETISRIVKAAPRLSEDQKAILRAILAEDNNQDGAE